MADVSVAEAANRLGVDRSRVRQLLRSGALDGRRVGRDWMVSAAAVVDLVHKPRDHGCPPAPRRVWALIDLLDGGDAPWLDPVARSHVRATVRAMAGRDVAAWQRGLRGREDRIAVAGHGAAIDRLVHSKPAWPAGPALAASIGADLVAHRPVPELYVPAEHWEGLARRLHLQVGAPEADAWVRVPRGLWPFGLAGPGRAALAASLLDGEGRAVRAGAALLNAAASRLLR